MEEDTRQFEEKILRVIIVIYVNGTNICGLKNNRRHTTILKFLYDAGMGYKRIASDLNELLRCLNQVVFITL